MRRMPVGVGMLVMFVVGCGGAAGESRTPAGAMAYPSTPAPEPAGYGGGSTATAAPAAPGAMAPGAMPGMPAEKADSARVATTSASPAPPPPPSAGLARPEPKALPNAGQLTAGIWDDNRNFDF